MLERQDFTEDYLPSSIPLPNKPLGRREAVRKALLNTAFAEAAADFHLTDNQGGDSELLASQQIGPYEVFYNENGYTGWVKAGGRPFYNGIQE